MLGAAYLLTPGRGADMSITFEGIQGQGAVLASDLRALGYDIPAQIPGDAVAARPDVAAAKSPLTFRHRGRKRAVSVGFPK